MNRRGYSVEEIRQEVADAIAERAETPAVEFSTPQQSIGFEPLKQMSDCCRAPMENEYCTSCGEPALSIGRRRTRAAGA